MAEQRIKAKNAKANNEGNLTSPSNQAQLRFNEGSCSDKVSETGFSFFGGDSALLGAISTAVRVKRFRPIYIFNTDTAVHFVAFGDSSLAAPASAAAGIPIPAGRGIVLSSGPNDFVRADSATVFGYQADDSDVNVTFTTFE